MAKRGATGGEGAAAKAKYFADAGKFRAWLAKHAATEQELLVGFGKRGSGIPSMTWPESVDEALCVGWIDGVRRRVDDERYVIRFTPRKAGSVWSATNIKRMAVLEAEGRVTEAGCRAFAARREDRSAIYAYEQAEEPELSAAEKKLLKAEKGAWKFFEGLAPSYRRKLVWWVVSAKKVETRERRMGELVRACGEGRKL